MRRPLVLGPLAVAAALGLAGTARAQDIRHVTLAEALELSVRAQPTMVQARQDVRVAEAQRRQANGAFLPSVTASLATSKSGVRTDNAGRSISGPPINDSYGLSANYDLFTGFRRGAQRRSAGATVSQREATLLRQEFATALATKQAFYTALANAELVNVQQTRLRAADEQLKLTSERLRLGATTRSDSLRARVAYGNAQLALIGAQNDLRTAQAALARTIQVDGLVMPDYDSTLEVRVPVLDTAALRREALATAPSIREADAAVAAARANLGINRAVYLPTLSASYNSNWTRADSAFLGGQPFTRGWTLRFAISYPIFNGFVRETNIINADANAVSAVARQRDARLALDASLTQQLSSLETAAARIDVSSVSVAAAEEDLRTQRERYRLGAATILEVLTSQATLDQARVDLVRARYDYLTARAQVEALVGHSL
jgi:outer membrane protein